MNKYFTKEIEDEQTISDLRKALTAMKSMTDEKVIADKWNDDTLDRKAKARYFEHHLKTVKAFNADTLRNTSSKVIEGVTGDLWALIYALPSSHKTHENGDNRLHAIALKVGAIDWLFFKYGKHKHTREIIKIYLKEVQEVAKY